MFADTPDQQLFEAGTRRFLEANFPVSRIRELADAPTAFEPTVWREGAALGWTTLLVPDEAGGGSISGNGLADVLIVASLFGQHAAPGPLLGTNVVAAALGRWGSTEQQTGPLAEIVAGESVAAWAHASTRGLRPSSRVGVTATPSGSTGVLRGRLGSVESASDTGYLLLTADAPQGRTQFLVAVATVGVQLSALRSIDLTRRFYDVILDDVVVPVAAQVGEAGSADEHDADLLDIVAAMLLGEMVGAIDRAFTMTLEWTFNRYSFGRPLGSYQEIKHRVADMRTHLEAGEAVAARAARAVGTGAQDARSWVSAGMTYLGHHAPEVIQDCIQLHGGIGVTYDHDLHLFLRRATLDAQLFGSPSDFAQRLGLLVSTAEGAMA